MSCEFAQHDGAYVLGSLAPADRSEFEEHLTTCTECARAVRQLAGIPGLLSRLDIEMVEGPVADEPVPDTLLPGLVRVVRRSQRRRLTLMMGGAVAAAALVVTSLAVTGVLRGETDVTADGPPTSAASADPGREMTQIGQDEMRASVVFEDVAWGTRLNLTCAYALDGDDYDHGSVTSYALVVRTRNGRAEQVATWRAVPGKTTMLTADTASSSADIASLEVRTLSGEVVLRLRT